MNPAGTRGRQRATRDRTATTRQVRRRGPLTALLIVIVGFVVFGLVLIGTTWLRGTQDDPAVGPPVLVRENSHVLGEPGNTGVVVVEFLDLECEACRAFYPLVEQLRADYAGEVTFVARYFPIDSHPNSTNAALATEAAAQQDQFEAMYRRMFETQTTWSHQEVDQAPLFRSYAQELNLDMAAYDAAISDPATLDRVELDRDDGLARGVRATPTFFIDGQQLQPSSAQDFYTAIDQAIASS